MKTLVLMGAALCLWQGTANAQARLSLYEEFTGETCGSCASANPSLDALLESTANASKVHMIKYMCNIPSPGPVYYMNNTIFEDARQTYYNVPFAPFGTFDGQIPSSSASSSYPGFSAYVSQSDVDQYSAIASPFTIDASYKYSAAHDSITVTVKVTAVAAYAPASGNIKLQTVLCKSLHFASPVSNGEQDIPNVVRAMYPSVTGTGMAATWAVGATQTYTIKGAVPSETLASAPHTATDSTVVVWIQNDNDKKIAQTALARMIPVGITNTAATAPSVTVFPNPAANNMTLSVNTSEVIKMTATIVDAAGRVLMTLPEQPLSIGTNNIDINTEALSSGVYFVKMAAGANIVTRSFSIAR